MRNALPRTQDCHFYIPRSVAPVIITDQEANENHVFGRTRSVIVRTHHCVTDWQSVFPVKTTSAAGGPQKVDHRAAPRRTLWTVDRSTRKHKIHTQWLLGTLDSLLYSWHKRNRYRNVNFPTDQTGHGCFCCTYYQASLHHPPLQ